jgi:hypothetical protein
MRSRVVVIGVVLMAVGMVTMLVVINILNDDGSETSFYDVEIDQEDKLWWYRAMLLSIGLMVTGFLVIGIGFVVGPVKEASLDDYYVGDQKAFEVEESVRDRKLRRDAPYWRQHVRVGTVVVFCKGCGYANLPEDERCSKCGKSLVKHRPS